MWRKIVDMGWEVGKLLRIVGEKYENKYLIC